MQNYLLLYFTTLISVREFTVARLTPIQISRLFNTHTDSPACLTPIQVSGSHFVHLTVIGLWLACIY